MIMLVNFPSITIFYNSTYQRTTSLFKTAIYEKFPSHKKLIFKKGVNKKMKQVKKFFCALILIISAFSVSVSAYSDVSQNAEFIEAAYRLSDLGILSGYEDGTFRAYNNVTRAQVAKMIVCIMGDEESAKNRGYSSRFSDVTDGHWAVPYINYATKSGILKGYADGTFGPERNVTYAELSAIMLRMLKYSEDDLGYNWPSNYTSKATSLGWNQGRNIGANEVLTRDLTVMLIDDALFTDINKAAGEQNKGCLLSQYDKEVLEDVLLMALSGEDTSLASNEMSVLIQGSGTDKNSVYKSDITYKNFSSGEVFSHVVVEKEDGHIVAARRYKDGDEDQKETLFATINHVVGDQIEYIDENGMRGTITFDSGFVTYVNSNKSTYAMSKQEFTQGTDITLYGEKYGDWDFVVISSNTSTEPVLASKNYSDSDTYMEGTAINKANLIVYRNGATSSLSDIKMNDVVYYNQKTNIMDVYTKKITGIYYDAKPSKAYVTSVTVGGKDYEIGTLSAAQKLDASSGAYNIGDRVTLILGKDDEVVFVKNITGFNNMDYGVVLSSGTRIKDGGEYIGKSEYITTLFMPDGKTYEYVTDKDYSSYKGKLVKLSDTSGMMSISGVNQTSNFSGEIDKNKKTIAGKTVSKDTAIIQRINNSDGDILSAEILEFNTLDIKSISSAQVKNVVYDSFGDIGILYVGDLTDSGYSYGVLASKKIVQSGEAARITYSIYTEGVLRTYTTDYNSTITSGPVKFKIENGQLAEIKSLTSYASASEYEAIDETRIRIGNKTYDIDQDVKIFQKSTSNKYEEKSFTDLKEAKLTSITVYSNVPKNSDGFIKVIVYTAK